MDLPFFVVPVLLVHTWLIEAQVLRIGELKTHVPLGFGNCAAFTTLLLKLIHVENVVSEHFLFRAAFLIAVYWYCFILFTYFKYSTSRFFLKMVRKLFLFSFKICN